MRPNQRQLQAEQIRQILRVDGSVSASELSRRMGVSQPTFSRIASEMPDLLRFGVGRRTQYALRRELRNLGSSWPLYRVTESGEALHFGDLHSLAGDVHGLELTPAHREFREVLLSDEFRDGLFPVLPWFLDESRPQGYLGRAFAKTHADRLQLSLNPEKWTNDEAMVAILHNKGDAPGNWILGEEAIRAFQQTQLNPETIPTSGRLGRYSEIVHALTEFSQIQGSSAGGEQPKFAVTLEESSVRYRSVIVKLSGPLDHPSGRRWADLLALEALSSEILTQADVKTAPSQLLDSPNRRFLEIDRFDRVGLYGRRGFVSLRSLVAAHVGGLERTWEQQAETLQQSRWIDESETPLMRRLHHFGTLIGNTDMHGENLSFWLTPHRPLSLAPVYDMLPMRYAPDRTGDQYSGPLSFQPPLPQQMIEWRWASELAEEFWDRASKSEAVSPEMRQICEANTRELRRVRRAFP